MMSMYLLVVFAAKYLYILPIIVPLQRSTAEDFFSFSVDYNSTPKSFLL